MGVPGGETGKAPNCLLAETFWQGGRLVSLAGSLESYR